MEKPVDYSAPNETIERAVKSERTGDAVEDRSEAARAEAPFPTPERSIIARHDDALLLRALIAEGLSLQRELAAAMADIAKENDERRRCRTSGRLTRESC